MIRPPETHPVKKVIGFTEEMLSDLETWRARQKPVPNLSEAIRRLVEIGLSKSEPPKRPKLMSTAKEGAARAAELAGRAIDKRADPNASDDQRKVRKRKLLQGPSVFRESRKDRPGK